MTVPFRHGGYGVRFAQSAEDVAACQALRHRCFFGVDGLDADLFDRHCQHLMIANAAGLVCTARVFVIKDKSDISNSYTATSYDLTPLLATPGPYLEVGRFCIAGGAQDADVLRLAWGALAALVDQHHISLIFGCSSFAGVDPSAYRRGFSLLGSRYQSTLGPRAKAAETISLTDAGLRGGAAELPPLLRSYLAMGGWVSDHAVIDRALNTMHVFTGLEVAKIPLARARALRKMFA